MNDPAKDSSAGEPKYHVTGMSGTWITQFPGNFVWSNAALVTRLE